MVVGQFGTGQFGTRKIWHQDNLAPDNLAPGQFGTKHSPEICVGLRPSLPFLVTLDRVEHSVVQLLEYWIE